MKKKIIYVITKSNWGGAQRNVFDLAVGMKKKGHDVSIVLGGDGILKKKLGDAAIRTYPIATLGRDMSAKRDVGSFKEIFSIIKQERPDVLHLHSPKAAGLGTLAARVLGVKNIVYTVHGWTFNEDRPLYERIVIIFLSWLTMLLCHKVILLSKREYAQALRFPFIKNKLTVIPLGITPPIFISADTARKEIGARIHCDISKSFVIGTVAELHKNKGLRYLLDAIPEIVKNNPNVVCTIIGEGEERVALESLIKEKRLERTVFLAGYLDEAAKYLRAFDVFVLPSIKEGLPYVLLEAGLASLPVVVTDVGGVPEIVENMKSGILVKPKNQTELANAISFMIKHLKEQQSFASDLNQSVTQKFSFEEMLLAIENLYKSH